MNPRNGKRQLMPDQGANLNGCAWGLLLIVLAWLVIAALVIVSIQAGG